MKRNRQIFWIGLLIYVLSFFLAAVGPFDASKPMSGYFCAYATLLFSWEQAKLWLHGVPSINKPLEYVSVLISGWINPAFLLAVLVTSDSPSKSSVVAGRIILILMIPFCWIVFYYHQLYPREGYFLWIAGMLMVLFPHSAAPSMAGQLRYVSR
jgi:hypothetical protein